jgi:hypothetical protein
MGEAILAWFQPVLDLFGAGDHKPPKPQHMVAGYKADYSGLTNEQIAAPAACDELFQNGNWISVNRKS